MDRRSLGPCPTCRGSRHVPLGPGRWGPCECLRALQASERWSRAEIPARWHDVTWRGLLGTIEVEPLREVLEAARELRARGRSDRWLLVEGPAAAREGLVALLAREAVDGGARTLLLDLPRLVDVEFRRGEELGPRVYKTEVLCLSVGQEPPHKYNKFVLEKALRVRWAERLCTVVSTSIAPARLAGVYQSAHVEDAVSKKFARIRAWPKEKA